MTREIYNYLNEKNLEIYFDYLELLGNHTVTPPASWWMRRDVAGQMNRSLDEKFHNEMWKDHGFRYAQMLDDICNRKTAEGRVIRQSAMNTEC